MLPEQSGFASEPYMPTGAAIMPDLHGIADSRDRMSELSADAEIGGALERAIASWRADPENSEPLRDVRQILEIIRQLPPSERRARCLNTLVRSLGSRHNLALYLRGILRGVRKTDSDEFALFETTLQDSAMVSMYGWTGQICLSETSPAQTAGTHPAVPGLQDIIGNSPATWRISLHIWQPNKRARGFAVNKQPDTDLILEPPHSHPFDFVSYCVAGEAFQSRYEPSMDAASSAGTGKPSRYGDTRLEHVDGIWPPHRFQESATLREMEHRVKIVEGQSYYMPCNWVHDFGVSAASSHTQPSITLFVSTECMVVPHAYIAPTMADFHAQNPDLKAKGRLIEHPKWENMLSDIADYLDLSSEVLDLADVVDHQEEYAFFHVSDSEA